MSQFPTPATDVDHRRFAGRSAVVTGGGSGIGSATALVLAELGATVMVVGRRAEAVEKTVAGHENIRWVAADVTSPADVDRIVKATIDASGQIDVVVNNAGFMVPTPLGGINVEAARGLWATNVLGPTLLTQAALPELARTQGSIVNVSSSFAHRPAPGASHYGASKAALEQLTRSWALELADRGIRVNAVAPGPTESEALERSGLPTAQIQQIKERERAQIPLGRRGEPLDVARWIIALADPAATWTTGMVVGVDGGFGLT